MGKWILAAVVGFFTLTAAGLVWLKIVHGGGEPYPYRAAPALIAASQVNPAIQSPLPPGMVASAANGRLFYTYHMLHEPERFSDATVFEWVNGHGVPFPSAAAQAQLQGAMGITTDQQGRLWVIKPGALAGRPTQLLAFDMISGNKLVDYYFAEGSAGFAQDMRVSLDGNRVYLADTGLFKFTQASLIVFDVATQSVRTLLKGHPSVSGQDWVLRKTDGSNYRLALGLLTFHVGVDGIALSADGFWLYYATMSHDSLYRIPTQALDNPALSADELAQQVDFVGHKPMSDGIELLPDNTVIITDVENGGLAALKPDGSLHSLTLSGQVDWADSVTVAANGDIWFTDSRLTALIDQFARPATQQRLQTSGPYPIYQINAAIVKRALTEVTP